MKIYMIVLLIVTSNIISGSENCWQPRVFTAHRECQKCGESRPWTDTFCSNCMTNLKLKHDRYDLSVEELEILQAEWLQRMSEVCAIIVVDAINREPKH